MYSWSSKRSYKNGFVWHDLSEDDFIHPIHGHEYVLKGTDLVHIDGHSTAASADAATQTAATDRRPHDAARRGLVDGGREVRQPQSSSCSSGETLEALIQAEALQRRRARRRLVARQLDAKEYVHDQSNAAGGGGLAAGRAKGSAMVMHLFSCGSIAVKDHGRCLVSQYKAKAAFAARREFGEESKSVVPSLRKAAGMAGVEKEYLSRSSVETRKTLMES